MQIFAAIAAFFQAIPVFDKWLQGFIAYYVNAAIERMAKENLEAIKAAIEKRDQRDLEKALGNPRAGEPSGVPGANIRDHLPGVDGSGLPNA